MRPRKQLVTHLSPDGIQLLLQSAMLLLLQPPAMLPLLGLPHQLALPEANPGAVVHCLYGSLQGNAQPSSGLCTCTAVHWACSHLQAQYDGAWLRQPSR